MSGQEQSGRSTRERWMSGEPMSSWQLYSGGAADDTKLAIALLLTVVAVAALVVFANSI